jgi:thioredoxin-dependent peroxiredoxin
MSLCWFGKGRALLSLLLLAVLRSSAGMCTTDCIRAATQNVQAYDALSSQRYNALFLKEPSMSQSSPSLPVVGKAAPAFSLQDQQGNTVKLSDLKGKTVVLYFYPKAMTPGCTVQACGLRDSADELAKHNIVVLGVSPDPVNKLQKFVEKEGLNFTLLSDIDHSVSEAYGSWGLKKFMGREYMGVLRQTFIIDAAGNVVHSR